MAGASKATINHDRIREWVEAHGGHPAAVKGTGDGDDPGILRIDFPGYSGEGKLEEITWKEFFDKFDESELAFLYQEGEETRFNKLVKRESVDELEE